MTAVQRWYASDLPITDAGFPTHDDAYREKMKLYCGYKSICMRCEHSCKQWNSKSLRIIYCPAMDRRAK